MKPWIACSAAIVVFATATALSATGRSAPLPTAPDAPRYDAKGRLLEPANYRTWVFLTSGLDMNYQPAGAAKSHTFGNVFVPRAAYEFFLRHGVWPDKTILVVERREGVAGASINKAGLTQNQDVEALEYHVKDLARFKGGWGFYSGDKGQPADYFRPGTMPPDEDCYACHLKHGAADTTFVQFYPTLLPVAKRLGTLSPAYIAESGGK